VITEQFVRELAEFDSDGAAVTSCYLDVDGRAKVRGADVAKELERVVRRVAGYVDDEPSVGDDIARMTAHVRAGIDRKGVRGLAMFSCAPQEYWQVVPLPVPVHSRITVGHAPAVGQLESVVEELRPIGVLLVDRQRTRLFVYEMGELVDLSEQVEELPRDYDERGQWERGDTSGHVAELVHQHLRHAAKAAFDLFGPRDVGRVALGGAPEAVAEVEGQLHSYLRERLAGRLNVAANAAPEEVRSAVLDLQARAERERESAVVARLRDAVGAGSTGVGGLGSTLQALNARRVERLVVSEDFHASGWRCPSCGGLTDVGPRCGACEQPAERIDDVVEEAMQEALAQGCLIEVCVDNADLDVMGRIGALLRY
jgi:peptide chain release factor subunit 1